jgi:phosphate-selective porin OprO and OprP
VLPVGGALAQTAKPPSADASLIENMAAELSEMRERIESLESELTQMREGARAAQIAPPATTPSWTDDNPRPKPEVTSRTGDDTSLEKPVLPAALQIDRGKFPIETFGQIQYDFSYVANPNDAINTTNLGYNGTARRLIFGFRGGLPGGFRYNLEFMLARELVDYEDVTLSWEPEGKPYSIKIGNHYPFTGLENLTSNKRNSFLERSAANDAFNFNRRIGASVGYANKRGDVFLNAGLFNGFINNSASNTDYVIAGRGVYAPEVLGGRIHLGPVTNIAARRHRIKPSSTVRGPSPKARTSA